MMDVDNFGRREFLPLPAGGGGGGAGSNDCDCCTEGAPDLAHPGTGLNTMRAWKLQVQTCNGKEPLSQITKQITGGKVTWPGGSPVLVWNAAREIWVIDVSGDITVTDGTDADVTDTATITTAEFQMELVDGGEHTVEFVVDVTI